MKILVVGSGGREHALSETFYRQGHRVFCIPGNAGTEKICEPLSEKYQKLECSDLLELAQFAKKHRIDLSVAGPEEPLARGIAGLFKSQGLDLFGPSMLATALESSKSWSKAFMKKHGVPTAPFEVHSSQDAALAALPACFDRWQAVVVKPSGLSGGKGVVCAFSLEEAAEAIFSLSDEARFGEAGKEILLEQHLEGVECSLLAFCDGKRMVPMLPSQDHKRLLDGDRGPNTGGMGAYAPLPFLSSSLIEEIEEKVIAPTAAGLLKEGIAYKGVLYFGLMLTASGPKVLEYNCRFGDPEAQALLPLIESDLASVMQACCRGALQEGMIHWKRAFSCCVVLSSEGYPRTFKKGFPIQGAEERGDVRIFHAGTRRSEAGELLTDGGRVLGVTGTGETLASAVETAYAAVQSIRFQGLHYRRDIASKAF